MRSINWAWLAVPAFVLGCSGASDASDPGPTDDADDTGGTSTEGGTDSAPTSDSGTETTDSGPLVDTGVLPDGAVDTGGDGGPPPPGATVPNLKVAFIGDQGSSTNTINVMRLIKTEGAAFVIVLGDFDYANDADDWDANLVLGLGADYPVFAAIGNHDVPAWPDYKKKLEARLAKISGARCTGEYGVKMSCNYQGLFFLLSGVGTMGTGHEAYIKSELEADKSIWRICAWHKNQRDMQVGGKTDEVGWEAYRLCQNNGALVMTGHEHSYSRTKSMNAVSDRAKGHGAYGDFDKLIVKTGTPGSNFVTVSGLGGVEIRDHEASHDSDTWWASWFASNGHLKNGVRLTTTMAFGATFVTFNVDGNPKKARGYFKSVTGVEIDKYEVTRE